VRQHLPAAVIAEGTRRRLETTLAWMERGTDFFVGRLAVLHDDELSAPSALPGWSRLHVLSHMARNARGLENLLRWAQTGVESPMYPSPEHRARDIEAGADRPPAEVRAEALAEIPRLRAAVDRLAEAAWEREVRTALGLPVLAAEVPWMRVREVWVHTVDLAAGVGFDDVEPAVARALVEEAVGRLAARDDAPAVELVVPERDERWVLGPGASGRTVVSGALGDLAAWLLGRSEGTGLAVSGALPALAPWL
jgi:maleylpyruvate isomerase